MLPYSDGSRFAVFPSTVVLPIEVQPTRIVVREANRTWPAVCVWEKVVTYIRS